MQFEYKNEKWRTENGGLYKYTAEQNAFVHCARLVSKLERRNPRIVCDEILNKDYEG